jgi:glycosyltransferase involved in cell wall biosynthesis
LNYKYYKYVEKQMLINSDIITAVSEFDKKTFKKLYPKSKIMIFRNAVKDKKIKKIKHKEFNILISGSFGDKNSPMNISTRWFMEKIFPLIQQKIKNLKVFIIGINSTREFKNKKQIFVKDWVLDITKFFSLSDIAAVPLKYESGTRFKILEAGIYNLPVVSTTLGAEGLNYEKNKSILIADDPKKFSDKVIYLYQNPRIRKKIASINRRLVISTYSSKNLKKDGIKILKKIS